jgi:glycerate kinase
LGGRRESGVAVVAEQTRLADDIAAAGLIVTGEGRFADQSSQGNVVSAVAAGARRRGVPVLVLAGPVSLDAANQLAGMAAAAAAQLRTDRE